MTTAEAVDSFQYQVQDRIWWKKHLYDFNDFVECVDNVWKSCLMATEDFFDFKSYKSKAKYINYLKLAEISEVQFCKGETKMFWKTLFEKSEYRSGELLQKNFVRNVYYFIIIIIISIIIIIIIIIVIIIIIIIIIIILFSVDLQITTSIVIIVLKYKYVHISRNPTWCN